MSNGTNENDKCKLHRFEKNNYFYGKLMTVRDFETEQSYFDEKRHLINRLLHGSGLVCGFETLEIKDNGDKITINFIDGGMALDCCGREIVVPENTLGKPIVDSGGNSVLDLAASPYLYLRYKPCYDGYVAAASNPSSCEEKCCPGRIVEDFEVIASNVKPDLKSIACRAESSDGTNGIIGVSDWLEKLEKAQISCPECGEEQKYKIFLGEVGAATGGGFEVNREDTEKYRIFFTEKELYQLLKCHILDLNNPHEVTAEQTGALASVDGVSNPGGDVDLVAENAIVITPDDPDNKITIGETHSAKTDNPHGVTAEQTKSLVSVDGVSNPGGDVDLVADNAIVITPDDPDNKITIGETHSAKTDNPHGVTAKQTGALVSISGISNAGGNVDLTAGANIEIALDHTAHTIKIASTGGAIPATTVKSVGTSLSVGTSYKYSLEDHVHDLGGEVVDFENLSKKLQSQLNLLCMYLRERALKCTVTSFKVVGNRLNNETAFKIADRAKTAVISRDYEKEGDFYNSMNKLIELISSFISDLEGIEGSDHFRIALENLVEANSLENTLQVAALQDEVCFYALELKISE